MNTLRSSLVPLAFCAAAAGLLLALCSGSGIGKDPQWLEPAAPAAPRAANATVVQVPELAEQRLALIWQQPLFSPLRQPDPAAERGADTGLAGLSLGGVVLDGKAQWALLRQGQRSLKLKVGERLDNGWTLQTLSARQATFSHQGQQRQLNLVTPRLPTANSDDIPRLPAPSVVHADAPQEAEPPVTAP